MEKLKLKKIIENKLDWINKNLGNSKQNKEKKDLYTREQFTKIVEKNANELIKQTQLVPNKIRIKNIKYAWGTCSSNRNITINYNLIKYNEDIIKYVILHELCHLKYMNHSKDFWNLIEKYMSNYKEIKKQLKS